MDTRPKTFVRARVLRKAMTRTEMALWQCVRAHQLDGLKFRRQHPIGPYILDFYCGMAHLAVEIDGASHESPEGRARDARRDAFVRAQGIATLRITVGDLKVDLEKALDAIRSVARARIERQGLPYPPPSAAIPRREGRNGPQFRGRYRKGGGFSEDGAAFAYLPRSAQADRLGRPALQGTGGVYRA